MQSQLDLFDNPTEAEELRREIQELRKRNDSLRKGLFARHNELFRLYLDQQKEIENLKCQSKK